jgi:hypothetical protein
MYGYLYHEWLSDGLHDLDAFTAKVSLYYKRNAELIEALNDITNVWMYKRLSTKYKYFHSGILFPDALYKRTQDSVVLYWF